MFGRGVVLFREPRIDVDFREPFDVGREVAGFGLGRTTIILADDYGDNDGGDAFPVVDSSNRFCTAMHAGRSGVLSVPHSSDWTWFRGSFDFDDRAQDFHYFDKRRGVLVLL